MTQNDQIDNEYTIILQFNLHCISWAPRELFIIVVVVILTLKCYYYSLIYLLFDSVQTECSC